jgi:hypothetical protein
MFKHFSSIRQNVFLRDRQTFQLGETFCAFVKHFSSASSNISARRQNVSCVRQTFQLNVKHFSLTLGSARQINLP